MQSKVLEVYATEILKHSTLCNISFPEFLHTEDFRDTQFENLSIIPQVSSLVFQACFKA